jgi:hypothetical protein
VRIHRLAAPAVVLALVAACSTRTDPPAPAAAAAPALPSTSPSPSPATSSTPAAHRLGEAVTDTTNGFTVTVTVHAYKQPSAPAAPKPESGGEWGSIDVQVCLKAQPVDVKGTISWAPWALIYADGAVVTASNSIYSTFPKPQMPNDSRIIPVGGCIRGWVTFPARTDAKPTLIEYQPTDVLIDWAVT